MGQPYRIRFQGHEAEIIRDVELYGRVYAMNRWHCNDDVAFGRWLIEQGKGPDFGRNPKFNLSTGRDLGDQLIDSFTNYVLRSEAKVRALQERVKVLELQLENKQIENIQRISNLLEAVQV